MVRRSSSAVATSREGQRSQDYARTAVPKGKSVLIVEGQHALLVVDYPEEGIRRQAYDGVAPTR
jgi:hypothetical protein